MNSKMFQGLMLASLLLATGSAAGQPVLLVEGQSATGNLLEQLLADGWEVVHPDVMQRVDGRRVETVLFGRQGLIWELRAHRVRLEMLERLYESHPLPEVLDAIVAQELLVGRVEAELAALGGDGEPLPRQGVEGLLRSLVAPSITGCTTTISRDADAYGTATGPAAESSGSFTDDCSTYGEAYAYAEATGTEDGHVRFYSEYQNDQGFGAAASSARADVVASSQCSSYGFSRVRLQDDLGQWTTWLAEDTAHACRALAVSISGPTSVYVPACTCKTVTWSAVTSGGYPPYAYLWRYNGVAASTSSSLSKKYCATKTYSTFTVQVAVTVTDQDSETASDSRNVRITLDGLLEPLPNEEAMAVMAGANDQAAALPSPCTAF